MAPRIAVTYASILNFVGAFISLEVAATVADDIVEASAITPTVVFAGLIGAIAWNLTTWYYGLPSSSSHALIGGVVGATLAAAGSGAVLFDGIAGKVLIPAVIAPIVAFVVGAHRDRRRLPDRRQDAPRPRQPRLPARSGRLGRNAGAGARHQRRPEDDGRDHAGARRQRLARRRRRRADLGRDRRGVGDRARHLQRRLADHQDDGHPDHQDGHGPGLLPRRAPERP